MSRSLNNPGLENGGDEILHLPMITLLQQPYAEP